MIKRILKVLFYPKMPENRNINLPSILIGISIAIGIALIGISTLFNPDQEAKNPLFEAEEIIKKLERISNSK